MSRGQARLMLGWCIAGTLFFVGANALGAANDQPYPVGELSSTMGGAAAAIVHDGSAPWYNPAGLGRVSEEGISASLNVYGLQMERTPNFVGTAELSGTTTAIFPGSLGYVKPLGVPSSRMQHALGLSLVVPDFARHELALDEKLQGDPGYELHVRERLLEQTLWIVPGWGACLGPSLCVGAALHAGYWSSTGLFSYFEQYADASSNIALSSVMQEEYSAVLLSGSLGVQWQMSDRLWLGGSLRFPATTVWGGGNVLVMDGSWDSDDATSDSVRRATDEEMKIDRRIPLNLRVGAGYDTGRWLVALDLGLSLPQAKYASVRAQDGSTQLPVVDPAGFQVGEVDVGYDDARDTIFNVNLGAQYRMSPKTSIQAGFFTDFSGQPDSMIDEIHNHVNHYGITAGVAMKGASSLTFVGIIAVLGSGRSYGIDYDQNGEMIEKSADATSNAIYFTLGGSTRLGEAPEREAPPEPAAPPQEEVQLPSGPNPATVAPEPPRTEEVTPASRRKTKRNPFMPK